MKIDVPFEELRKEKVTCWTSSPLGVMRVYMSFYSPPCLPWERVIMQKNDMILLYMISGTGRYEDENGVSCELRPGVFLQRMPGREHRIERYDGSPWLEFAGRISRPLFDRLFEIGMIRDQVVFTPGMDAIVLSFLRDTIARLRSSPSMSPVHAILEFQHFLQHIYSRERAGRRDVEVLAAVRKACDLLCRNFNHNLTMPEVARQVGLGYHNFRKIFTENIGMSPKGYRVNRRIECSQELILEGKMGLSEIADHLGYTDQAAFAKQFKRVTGMTPGAFRTSW